LKTKQAVKSLHHLSTPEQLTSLKLAINAEHPSPKVDQFSAYVKVVSERQNEENANNPSVAVDHNNLLIRVRSYR